MLPLCPPSLSLAVSFSLSSGPLSCDGTALSHNCALARMHFSLSFAFLQSHTLEQSNSSIYTPTQLPIHCYAHIQLHLNININHFAHTLILTTQSLFHTNFNSFSGTHSTTRKDTSPIITRMHTPYTVLHTQMHIHNIPIEHTHTHLCAHVRTNSFYLLHTHIHTHSLHQRLDHDPTTNHVS